MDETNNLAFDIRARILPQIEGINEFAQNLQNSTNPVIQQVNNVVGSPGFQEGLTPQQRQLIPEWTKYNEGVFENFNTAMKDLVDDMNVDLSTGKLSKGQLDKYTRKFERMKLMGAEAGQDVVSDASDFFKLNKEHLDMIRATVQESRGELNDNIDFLKNKLHDIAAGFKKTGTQAQGFYDTLRKAGIFTVGMEGANSILSFIRTGAVIEARGMTAFDLSSPMGMFSEGARQETFASVQNRDRIYQIVGMAVGTALGFAFGGGPAGAAAGGAAGNYFGSEIANILGMTQTSETEGQLKYLNQMYGTFGNAVGPAANYDILRARLHARLGRGIGGSLGYGYSPEEEMQMRMGFADTLGHFDRGLYGTQTTFATALGLSPREIYQLNVSGRVTGADYGIRGLSKAQQFTQELYGKDVNPERIIDVLNAIKTINEKQLQLNENADARNGGVIAAIPELIFGNKSPYGRISDLGGVTINNLQDMMNPRSDAQLAFLFQAMGTNNISHFNEMMKGGTFSGDNFIKILDQIRRDTGGDKNIAYWELNSLMPNAPQGMIPEIRDIMTGGRYITRNKTDERGNLVMDKGKPVTESVWMTLDKFENELKAKTKAINDSNLTEEEKAKKLKESQEILLGWTKQAHGAMSETSKMMSEIRSKQNEIADAWRKLVYGMQNDWLDVFKKISMDNENREKLSKEFINAETDALNGLWKVFNDHGIYTEKDRRNAELLKNGTGIYSKKAAEFNPYGLMENSGNFTPAALTDQLTKFSMAVDTINTVMNKLNDNLDKGIKVQVYSGPAPTSGIHELQNSVPH